MLPPRTASENRAKPDPLGPPKFRAQGNNRRPKLDLWAIWQTIGLRRPGRGCAKQSLGGNDIILLEVDISGKTGKLSTSAAARSVCGKSPRR